MLLQNLCHLEITRLPHDMTRTHTHDHSSGSTADVTNLAGNISSSQTDSVLRIRIGTARKEKENSYNLRIRGGRKASEVIRNETERRAIVPASWPDAAAM